MAVIGAILAMPSQVQPARAASAPDAAAAPSAAVIDSQRPVLEYNAGTAAYRAGQFSRAARSFQESISHAPSSDAKRLAVQEDSYYNLGNTLYRAGQKTQQSAPQETLQQWNDAVKAYETALQLRADDADSKFNRDLVKRKIDALKQQQNQQQNKNQNQNQQQNKDQQPNKDPQQNKPQNSGQNPPPGNGSGPQQGQPPNAQPNAKNNDPRQGEGQGPADPKNGEPQHADDDERAADNERVPGQMTREEARELLDSVKGDEHHSLGVPVAQRAAVPPPDKPFKNW
jgi:Ca-activated chloride channel family protein